ncbi:MAG: methionyl-tRNA formyltransferase [Candidatus Omnitrophica bacterium CG11_big_fil_rev_8_21_14_0_20_45_26]|uniref:Methionyl-tRNA formyltransferase n=1 Tax=Candidatus Abzuiibacterium crystallinum TaxID=1974748 RepID=A0A2H0LS98_9BACT|nr:MAG: methionyl-tRNA formyltransferase [Candidatus Omnitrophica bacterium CG11_big_fil_rev_8_21_14_0_20_45_26]PIW65052.1 MAG: methionyl-tRNA formyltransferase [Candidatus Omnitrophica bacterium CG12_big_fil_rev_8_21_14_0_65_45_16]
MKIVFFGSSEFSIPILEHLTKSHADVVLVVTTPERKKGRGLTPALSLVAQKAKEIGLPVFAPETLQDKKIDAQLRDAAADYFVIASYGKILPTPLLSIPKKFALNVHPSMLPKYRGASPIAAPLLEGQTKTGVSIALLTPRLDAGDLVIQEAVPIQKSDDALSLEEKLAKRGGELVIKSIELIEAGKHTLMPQKETEASYAHKIQKEDGKIDWQQSAQHIRNQVKAYVKWPGAYAFLNGKRIKILKADSVETKKQAQAPGCVTLISKKGYIEVSTGRGFLKIDQIQPESLRVMPPHAYALGRKLNIGDVFK